MDQEIDSETGEIAHRPKYNTETGEEEEFIPLRIPRITKQKQPFKIPTAELPVSREPLFTTKKRFILKGPALLYLLPTTIFFYPVLSLIIVGLEVILHFYAHKKNEMLKNSNIYYKSPLHIICEQFCALCIEERSSQKITKLQDKRNDKYGFDCVRRVV